MDRICLRLAWVCDVFQSFAQPSQNLLNGRLARATRSCLARWMPVIWRKELVKTNHGSAASARRELLDAGFLQAFSPPGTPEKWQFSRRKGAHLSRSTYTVARLAGRQSTAWEIMDYPI